MKSNKQETKVRNSRFNMRIHMDPQTNYVWVGGSCDYGHPERWGGASYILERMNKTTESYTAADLHTTEFRMMLSIMNYALLHIPKHSSIVFLTNVSYIKQSIESYPTMGADNQDLISIFIQTKELHKEVSIKIVSYHKYPQLLLTHQRAHNAMCELRSR